MVGESLGLVGESGCGKTTTGKMLVRLIEPTDGHIQFEDGSGMHQDIAALSGSSLKAFRRKTQMVFQDPYESLNPRQTVFDAISEPLRVQNIGGPTERIDRVSNMLGLVGLSPPSTFLFRYPHELSGGQRQRIVIARALVVEPTFVVADEPTSMLDVSVRTGVMRLMDTLGDRLGITYLYITHDLAVARYMCNRIAVMYLGKIVEVGETEELLGNPLHPYTKALLSAVPIPVPGATRDPVDIVGARNHSRGSSPAMPFLRPVSHFRQLLPRQCSSPPRRQGRRPVRSLLQGLKVLSLSQSYGGLHVRSGT